MDESFWKERWETGRTAFHEKQTNPLLVQYFQQLELPAGAHAFVPLCGATRDLDWLLDQGFRCTGIEFYRGAVEQVFERLSLTPEITKLDGLTRFAAGELTLWQGDFFALTAADLGPVDAVYDRAALVALPQATRAAYAAHLAQIAPAKPHLIVSYDYDQSQTAGPPFSVPEAEIRGLFSSSHSVTRLASRAITGPLAERCAGFEQVWHLQPGAG